MQDIPQPGDDPYPEGTRVQVYLAADDPDAEHHGRICIVNERITDDLQEVTGRKLDSILYRLSDSDTGDSLGIDFRHSDLVPVDED